MVQAEAYTTSQDEAAPVHARARRWPRVLFGLLALVLLAVAALYFSRERIVRNVIQDQLTELGLPATYDIENIRARRQVLTNLVFGDPAAPDLTIERVELELKYSWGAAEIGRITVVRPRLFGTYRDGALSFGSLDKGLFAESDEPPGLPAYDILLDDGRAQILTDFGPVGIKLAGEGRINDGFAGIVAATAPAIEAGGCLAKGATLYGDISVDAGKPHFAGPVRLSRLRCPEQAITLANSAVEADVSLDGSFDGGALSLAGTLGQPDFSGTRANMAEVSSDISFRNDRLVADYDISVNRLRASQVSMRRASAQGSLRLSEGFTHTELRTRVEGAGLEPGIDLAATMNGWIAASQGTLAEPLLAKLRDNLTREIRGSRFAANAIVRRSGSVTSATIPEARLRGASGDTLLAVSHLQYSDGGEGPNGGLRGGRKGDTPRFSANIVTGGQGLPRISGRMEQRAGATPLFRLRMAEYSAGNSSVAIPDLRIAQDRSGALAFSGTAMASGPLPGGYTEGLRLPVSGNWSGGGGLTLWHECAEIAFKRLQLANLTLRDRGLTLCPSAGRAIVDTSERSLRIAAGTPSLDLVGTLGETPIRLKTGAVGFAYPGAITAKTVDISLGPQTTASRFTISDLTGVIGDDISGRFSGADIKLASVPLDLWNTSGNWRYAGGRLTIADASFRLEDRVTLARFEPLTAQGATLSLADNQILAQARLQEPVGGQEIVAANIRHDLSTGTGSADLAVGGIRFGNTLQPDDLSYLAKGVIANTRGVITGEGAIGWNATSVTSSGAFSSENLDFAAAFGPVTGASGTVEFSDLIGLTTAPGQTIQVASVNPGIEVVNGTVGFALRGGEFLDLETGTFEFAGGTLTFQPVQMRLGAAETRRYVIIVTGLDAAQFVAGLELNNISASGIFDGSLPLIFDEAGNGRIEGGLLIARAPGGNVSYIGELTYEDITPMVDFAFDALRSLDYKRMRVEMDGLLSGELVTRVEFDGLTQGKGARSNFITRRIGRIPLKFRVNIRGPFSKIISSFAAMTDPSMIRDPRDLGLLGSDGKRRRRAVTDAEAAAIAIENELLDTEPQDVPVQGQESEDMP